MRCARTSTSCCVRARWQTTSRGWATWRERQLLRSRQRRRQCDGETAFGPRQWKRSAATSSTHARGREVSKREQCPRRRRSGRRCFRRRLGVTRKMHKSLASMRSTSPSSRQRPLGTLWTRRLTPMSSAPLASVVRVTYEQWPPLSRRAFLKIYKQ